MTYTGAPSSHIYAVDSNRVYLIVVVLHHTTICVLSFYLRHQISWCSHIASSFLLSIGKKKSVNLDYGRSKHSSVEGHRKNLTSDVSKTEKVQQHKVHIYWHKIGKRFTDKALLVESKQKIVNEHISEQTVYYMYDPLTRGHTSQINGKTYEIRVPPHHVVIFKVRGIMLLSKLSRLGHYLGVRKDPAGFVVTAYTGNILPRLIGHVTLSVVQHNDVLHWWQKLELAL